MGVWPTDLPLQAATKYELIINMKTAKGAGSERLRQDAIARRQSD
jgi:hypothetical protein